MIPLNRPLINIKKRRQLSIYDFVNQTLAGRNYTVTLSARQGLSLIYKHIFKTRGAQNVAVSPLTCEEALYPIIENGHKIYFVDVDSGSLNMDENLIPDNMDVVQAIHMGGNPQNMELIQKKNPGLIIEDCAQGFGATFNTKNLGLFGDYAAFSFMKNLYSLGGGLVILKEAVPEIFSKQKEFSFLPTAYRFAKRALETKCSYQNYLPNLLFNKLLRLKPDGTSVVLKKNSVNSIIEKSISQQLGIYSKIIDNRIKNAEYLLENITNNNLKSQKITNGGTSNYLRLFFILENKELHKTIAFLRSNGIAANHLTQNHLKPYQTRFDSNPYFKKYIVKKSLKNYYNVHDRIISIPISPSFKLKEMNYIISVVNKI